MNKSKLAINLGDKGDNTNYRTGVFRIHLLLYLNSNEWEQKGVMTQLRT